MAGKDKGEGTTEQTAGAGGAGSAESDKDKQAEARKLEQLGKDLADREAEKSVLQGKLGDAEKQVEELQKQVEDLTKRAEEAERQRDAYGAKLQQQKMGTLDLQKGQGQLKESVTLITDRGARVDAKLGSVVLRGADAKAIEATQKKVGKAYLVYSVTSEDFDELVANNLLSVSA